LTSLKKVETAKKPVKNEINSMLNNDKCKSIEWQCSQLCLACGICCQGICFWQDNDPKAYGMEPDAGAGEENEQKFPLACLLLRGEAICAIHKHPERPHICQDYQCQLLKRLLSDDISLEAAQRIISEIKALINSIKGQMTFDHSKPVISLLQDFLDSYQKSPTGLKRQNVELYLDVLSLLRLAHKYILPFNWGFIEAIEAKKKANIG
jgi:hypothetical protein